jgi:hypothetical protein
VFIEKGVDSDDEEERTQERLAKRFAKRARMQRLEEQYAESEEFSQQRLIDEDESMKQELKAMKVSLALYPLAVSVVTLNSKLTCLSYALLIEWSRSETKCIVLSKLLLHLDGLGIWLSAETSKKRRELCWLFYGQRWQSLNCIMRRSQDKASNMLLGRC